LGPVSALAPVFAAIPAGDLLLAIILRPAARLVKSIAFRNRAVEAPPPLYCVTLAAAATAEI
jgi:hypothetical protein